MLEVTITPGERAALDQAAAAWTRASRYSVATGAVGPEPAGWLARRRWRRHSLQVATIALDGMAQLAHRAVLGGSPAFCLEVDALCRALADVVHAYTDEAGR